MSRHVPTGWARDAVTVHLWHLDPTPRQAGAALPLLSPTERERAVRFADPARRVQYVATRGALRLLAAAFLGCAPLEVPIELEAEGKPIFGGQLGLYVSVAHAATRSIVGLAMRPLGIDIERVDRDVDVDRVAALTLTGAERRELASLGADERRRAYFRCWARKEAVAKGVGAGLALGLTSFAARAGRPVAIRWPARTATGTGRVGSLWWTRDLVLEGPYVGAVALADARPDVRSRVWRWDDLSSRLAPPLPAHPMPLGCPRSPSPDRTLEQYR